MPYYGYLYGWDGLSIIIMLVSLVISFAAQINVKSTFSKYNNISSYRGLTAQDAVGYVLRINDCPNVPVYHVSGNLTDHYSPKENVIRLSDSTYMSNSIAAIGVAAHEAGHAVQYNDNYFPIKIRSAIIPLCNIGSSLSWIVIVLGLAFSAPIICYIGVILFSFAVLFQLITLPVEFNASKRAIRSLSETGILTDEELKGARKVLTAAALTYVAALATSILQLLRLLSIARRSNR